jgi:peptidoglycan hydrolase-like protein with peptidoglycan-binding domain
MPIGSLSVGTFGPEVQALHDKLRQQGFYLPDSELNRQFFGPETRDAIMDLQRNRGLKVTGVVDEATRDSLGGLAIPISSGGYSASSNGTGSQQAIRSTTQSVPSQPASARGLDYSARDHGARLPSMSHCGNATAFP